MRKFTYTFVERDKCEMCKAPASEHRLLGQRLNRSQGRAPRSVGGISVSVMKCTRCGLIFANPMPVPESISDHYDLAPEDYWRTDYFTIDPGYFASEIATAKRLLGFQPGMAALDVGAGIGKAMKALEAAGFEAFGIEPSASFRDTAIKKLGIEPSRISGSAIEDAEFGPRFDFITFGAVLEHLYHPAEAIERAMTWLKPRGIVQIEVPYSSHLLAKIVNLYFRLMGTTFVTHISPMHPPFHLYEFGLQSFVEHGRGAGYELAEHGFHASGLEYLPIPRIFHRPLAAWMRRTKREMQLTVWLRRM